MRPLEASAQAKGVKFLLNYKMTSLIQGSCLRCHPGELSALQHSIRQGYFPERRHRYRSYRSAGNIDSTKSSVGIRAAKAVILATGGSTSNVNFLVHVRSPLDGGIPSCYEPDTFQDASGELAAMAIGASLWGLGNNIWKMVMASEHSVPWLRDTTISLGMCAAPYSHSCVRQDSMSRAGTTSSS